MDGIPIVSGDPQKGTIFFTDIALKNSFWAGQGVQANDVIKSVDGEALTLLNANAIFQKIFMWKPGKDIELLLERNSKKLL